MNILFQQFKEKKNWNSSLITIPTCFEVENQGHEDREELLLFIRLCKTAAWYARQSVVWEIRSL